MSELSRYIIGIDLGTTNSSVAYIDTDLEKNPTFSSQSFYIPQKTSEGYTKALSTLPSFCFLESSDSTVIGAYARDQGSKHPGKFVHSVKSWLCHPSANRYDSFLPLEAQVGVNKISPVEATVFYLAHIKEAWNASFGKKDVAYEFEQQEIVLTVPASFDESARALTVESAKKAGFGNLTLLEEPQAAFYSWIQQHENIWEEKFKVGDTILVCDVGGGTTDFSLIEVQDSQEKMAFQRMAVGEHLLLGGDNIDIAIGHFLENRKNGKKGNFELEVTEWKQLIQQGREAKEALLDEKLGDKATHTIVLQGKGASVLKGGTTLKVQKGELKELLLKGFFEQHSLQDALKIKKRSGIKSIGLPYEEEASITKHLALFLEQAMKSVHSKSNTGPDYVLFNGGTMKPTLFQEAIVQALNSWFPQKKTELLQTYSLDLAVSRGAAYYGKTRRGLGVRIGGGSARGYYLHLENIEEEKIKALTLIPRGSEEGVSYVSDRAFDLISNSPVTFQLMTSHTRLNDKREELIEAESQEMHFLPPIQTVMHYGKKKQEKKIAVKIGMEFTEIGTLELWVLSQESSHKWFLEFQLRNVTGQEDSLSLLGAKRKDETFDSSFLEGTKDILKSLFENHKIKPSELMERLESALGKPRKEWPPSILRGLWETLLEYEKKRKISNTHDARWWNLAGFLLRPGFAYPLDDFRIKSIWKIMLKEGFDSKNPQVLIQMWICYRRIAGGLNKGQQQNVLSDMWNRLAGKRGKIELSNKMDNYQYRELVYSIASMERISGQMKKKIGEAFLAKIEAKKGKIEDFLCLGRMGARHLLYGSITETLSKEIVMDWVRRLIKVDGVLDKELLAALEPMVRKSNQRELNIPLSFIEEVTTHLSSKSLVDRVALLIEKTVPLTEQEQNQLLGDPLPVGLSLKFTE